MADNYPFKDGGNVDRVMRAKEIAGALSNRVIPQVADADVATGNPMPVSVLGTVPLPTGAATAANQATQIGSLATVAANQVAEAALLGPVNETAPGSDTGSSGINGRLQWLAQKLTTFLSRFPGSLGQKTAANSLPVVLASDQTVLLAGNFTVATGTLVRATGTASYASGQLIAQASSAGGCSPIALAAARAVDAAGRIHRVGLSVNDSAWAGATVRVHFFKATPVFLVGDTAALSGQISEASYLGSCDVVLDRSFSATTVKGWVAPTGANELNFVPASGTQLIQAVLEARSAVTAVASKTFTLTVETSQN